jgi:glycosyltransferase involved in cell wall biosynthesis
MAGMRNVRSRITRFGVVTPTLNADRFLEETLQSVWGQRSEGIEIDHLIVDGGSTDLTLDVASRYPSRVLVSDDDQGMYDAINRGMESVAGDVVGYINADDEITPGAFRLVSEAFERHPEAGWVCGRIEYVDADGNMLGGMMPVSPTLHAYLGLGWSCIPQQTVWIRRPFYERVGHFDTAYRNCGDYDWYARALRLQRPLIIRDTLGRCRLHEGQLSADAEKMARESRMVQERHGRRDLAEFVMGRILSLRLNVSNPRWLVAKKTGKIKR